MMKNRKKIAIVAIAALVVLTLIMSAVLRGCSQEEQQDPTSSTGISQGEDKQPNDVTTKPGEDTKPGENTKPGDEVQDTTPNETDSPGPNNNKPGETEKPGTGVEDPGTTSTTQPVKKTDPENGVDYTIPTNLRGTAGDKLSTVSLGDSNLVWLNPDEKLSTNKSQYEAKFEETSTKNEKVVTVMITVCKETPMEGTDYTVPTNLKGIVGDKLSTVSLGDSNLIWVNPDEVLTTNKTRYEAKFEATDTKGELVINVTVTVSKKTPIKGTDYSVPTNLRGTAGSKLSTVSLGNSHLVWVKPNETLSIQKTEYEAKFVETDTMKEVTVMVKVTVQRASSDDDNHGGGGGGGTTNPPINPNPPIGPGDDDDEGSSSDNTQQGGGNGGNGTTNPGTGDSGSGSGNGDSGDDDDEGSSSDNTQQGGGGNGGGGTTNPGAGGSSGGSGSSGSGGSNDDDEGSSSDSSEAGGAADDDDEGSSSDSSEVGGGHGVVNPGAASDEPEKENAFAPAPAPSASTAIADDDDEGESSETQQEGNTTQNGEEAIKNLGV